MILISGKHTIGITSMNALESILNNFGNLIEHFEIIFGAMDAKQSEEVTKIVNEKTFKTLKRLNLLQCQGSILNALKKPFENVYSLIFWGNKTAELLTKEDQKLSKMFPALKHLSLDHVKSSEWPFFGGIPSLISLNLLSQNVDSNVTDFLERNQQIQKFSFVTNESEEEIKNKYSEWDVSARKTGGNDKIYTVTKK